MGIILIVRSFVSPICSPYPLLIHPIHCNLHYTIIDIPGWSPSPHREFPSSESQIISLLRTSSYKILSLSIPLYPIPPTPSKPFYDTSKNKVMFQGVPWGHKYCLEVVGGDDIDDKKEIWDCTGEGEAGLVMQSGTGRRVRIRAISVEGKSSDWSESLTL